MIKWIKSIFKQEVHVHNADSDCCLPKTNCTTPMPSVKPPKDISEPVLSIVKTFSEKGRWKIENGWGEDEHPRYSNQSWYFSVTDTITEDVYRVCSDGILWTPSSKFLPRKICPLALPTWMTRDEREFVASSVNSQLKDLEKRLDIINDRQRDKSQKQTKAAQDKERKRLMKLYCGETK